MLYISCELVFFMTLLNMNLTAANEMRSLISCECQFKFLKRLTLCQILPKLMISRGSWQNHLPWKFSPAIWGTWCKHCIFLCSWVLCVALTIRAYLNIFKWAAVRKARLHWMNKHDLAGLGIVTCIFYNICIIFLDNI